LECLLLVYLRSPYIIIISTQLLDLVIFSFGQLAYSMQQLEQDREGNKQYHP